MKRLEADCFSYLGHNFSSEVPKCPQCGQVYISEDLYGGRGHGGGDGV